MTRAATRLSEGVVVAPPLDPRRQQVLASEPTHSVWVGASAGSGKTTILTQRVTRLLLAGVSPQRISCLTFTRAAAAQMAIKVMEQLSRWATCSDDELSASLGELQGNAPEPAQLITARKLFARALACPGGLRIRTIHAFCQEILRRFPLRLGCRRISPSSMKPMPARCKTKPCRIFARTGRTRPCAERCKQGACASDRCAGRGRFPPGDARDAA